METKEIALSLYSKLLWNEMMKCFVVLLLKLCNLHPAIPCFEFRGIGGGREWKS